MSDDAMLVWAQYYARLGLRVIPIKAKQKSPPLLADWPHSATVDAGTLAGWWKSWPGSNIGVAMGSSGLVDVETDVKPEANGETSLLTWCEEQNLTLPSTWSFRSGGGGIHRLFRCGAAIPNRVGVLPAVDVRAVGGYAVFPPSVHPSGQRYEWLSERSPNDMPNGPAPLPFELFNLIVGGGNKPPLEVPAEVIEGSRNDTLFRLACKLRRDGLNEGEIMGAVRVMNESRCSPPLSDDEISVICRQAAKYKAGELLGDAPNTDSPENTFTAQELMLAELGETRYVVVELLPQGLALLTSPPKYGKSWMVLDLCISTALGAQFLGHKTNRCGVLYLALEDGPRRLKGRMRKLLAGQPAPANLVFKTAAPDLSNGLLDVLERHMKQHPDTGLITIDTLQVIRGQPAKNESAYQYDYREMRQLKSFADRHDVVLLLVHHLRKMGDDSDPHNRISGTNGILGAADTSLVLTKTKKADNTATLSVTGRDVESSDTVVEFSKLTCRWKPIGSREDVDAQIREGLYRGDPIVRTIKALLERNGGKWRGTMSDLMDAGRDIEHVNLAENTRQLSSDVRDLESLLFEFDGIRHRRIKNGSGGGEHIFLYYNANDTL